MLHDIYRESSLLNDIYIEKESVKIRQVDPSGWTPEELHTEAFHDETSWATDANNQESLLKTELFKNQFRRLNLL